MEKASLKIFTASLLIAGTAIGAGMLALPIATAQGGFFPALVIYIACWLFSLSTGLLLLEACLWLPKDSNIISLSNHLLGKKGKYVSWILYLFLFYSLTVAYAAGGGGFVTALSNHTLSAQMSILLFILIFSPIVYLGTKAVDRFNFLLMVGLIGSFILFILIGFEKVNVEFLKNIHWGFALFSLPVVFTSFSYQGIVPSMRNYFHGNPKGVRRAIVIGSSIPVIVYVFWEYLILGMIPLDGAQGLLMAKKEGLTAVIPLKHISGVSSVYVIGQIFSFCALTTSFLGVTLGMFDFLADGLHLSKKGKGRTMLYLLVFVPPTLIAMLYPRIFIRALGYAGGIGCALLLGLLPVMMVWSGRYIKKFDRKFEQLPGGKWVLILLSLFIIFELFTEVLNELL